MKSIRNLNPSATGIGLFILSAAILSAIIVTGQIGMISTANLLIEVAQPVSACAIAVLTYLAIIELKPTSVE